MPFALSLFFGFFMLSLSNPSSALAKQVASKNLSERAKSTQSKKSADKITKNGANKTKHGHTMAKVPVVVVCSSSAIKVGAVKDALEKLGVEANQISVKAESGVNEQPFDDETIMGAKNRVKNAKVLHGGADLYVAVENGIFKESGEYFDRAVILIEDASGRSHIKKSRDAAKIPVKYIEEAKKIGFKEITVSKVMANHGVVAQHDDPHKTLIGKPRAEILSQTFYELMLETKTFKGN